VVSAPVSPSGLYFCLSHAGPATGVDHWVSTFFNDLNAEVSRCARRSTGFDAGFADLQPPGADRDLAVARALASAQVLVPLYSPDYMARQESHRELMTFRLRIPPEAATARPGNIQPVLWAPLQTGQRADFIDQALELGSGYSEYRDLGLAAMCRINRYRDHYKQIVATLAGRIVAVAERALLALAQPVPFADATAPDSSTLHFVVAVIAPHDGQLPDSRDPDCYGPVSYAWRPFRNAHRLPIAEMACQEVRLQNMPARVVDFAAGDSTLEASPGVILVDPWILKLRKGLPLLRDAFGLLRQWVSLIVVVDRTDRQYGRAVADLAGQVMRMRKTLQSGQLVRDAELFAPVMRKSVVRNRRHYLSEGPSFPPPGPNPPRERLTHPRREPPLAPPSEPGETR
jgi:FxsC-like protein